MQEARDQMERRLLEHYSATGRGIPIQIPIGRDLVDGIEVIDDNPF